MNNVIDKLTIFKSLFKGREDVFAFRWEKEKKSGYMPACYYDPYRYRLHKMNGGTFQNYNDKSFLKLTDEEITKHLNGEKLIGIYPLLKDNTSWFIAADFDKENWIDECRKFMKVCSEKNIITYLERSRSGKGGHVWIFFNMPYTALRSRKIFISLLETAGIFSAFDKGMSFDRLFPNQDYLSGKGFGNLIALPLYKKTLEEGNSCFIDPNTLNPYPNQWHYLSTVERTSVELLEALYHDITNHTIKNTSPEKMSICLDNVVRLNKSEIPLELITFLKTELNFVNSEFIIKNKIGRSTFGSNRYFKIIEDNDNEIIIPKGFIGKLIRFCIENKIEYHFQDYRKKLNNLPFCFKIPLRDYQIPAIEATSKKDIGIIVAPPGSGKTVIGLKIISDKLQPALIIVHRKQLADQWIERIETFLGIPKHEIGRIAQGKTKIGKQITVALIQSLSKELEKSNIETLCHAFGIVLVDECHHIPAEAFRNAIGKLHTYYLYGLTATPFRKYNDGKMIPIYLGDIIADIKTQDISTANSPKIIIQNTEFNVPFNSKTDKFETLSKILVHDSARNELISNDVIKEIDDGKKVIIITERKDHIETLYLYLKHSHEVITLSGEDSENTRVTKWNTLKEGNYQILITTGQLFGEGSDLNNVQCLFLAYPFSFEGKLIQYIGRVQRSEIAPIIYDYRDYKIDYLNKLFLKRNTYYRKIEKQYTLFDDSEEQLLKKESVIVTIDKTIKIPINQLDFVYGGVRFKYTIAEGPMNVDFEIESLYIRPEFEVLKPYFTKYLKSNYVSVSIFCESENGIIVSQSAFSKDIDSLNQEVIESVRFRFVEKFFMGNPKQLTDQNNLLDIKQLQTTADNNALYESEDALIKDILKQVHYKHHKQLNYLSERHESAVLKVRFALAPFAFIVLIAGTEQYHIVYETLDTEEATYIWHISKNIPLLKSSLKTIDRDLNIIKNHGRQFFLEKHPHNFSRILHDYSEGKKGFIIWKDLLEERLV